MVKVIELQVEAVGPLCRRGDHDVCTGFWDPGELYESYARFTCQCPCHAKVQAPC
jgi:hypothetical protein